MSGVQPIPVAWLGEAGGDRLGLAVERYQFPANSQRGDWDANWLMVRGEVESAGRAWSFVDPCLTTWDLGRLIGWLEGLREPEGSLPGSRVGFTEPVLEFQAVAAEPRGPRIIATLRGEALPAELEMDRETRWERGVRLDLCTAPPAMAECVGRLREFLARFPER